MLRKPFFKPIRSPRPTSGRGRSRVAPRALTALTALHAVVLLPATGLGGCRSTGVPPASSATPPRRIELAAFASPAAEPGEPGGARDSIGAPSAGPLEAALLDALALNTELDTELNTELDEADAVEAAVEAAVDEVDAASSEDGPITVTGPVFGAAGPSLPPLQPGDRMIVDSMVGQVNGRPIFADDFFEPIEDRLIALRAQTDDREFAQGAARLIFTELNLVVINALFIVEAEAGIPVEQEQGIRAFLKQRVVSGFGASEVQARNRILAEEGRTLEAYVEAQRDRALIQELLRSRIAPRVIVSWRDKEREYEKRYDEFNPPARVTLARIRLSTAGQTELIESVTTRLASGEEFMTVAESVPGSRGGVWDTFEAKNGDPSTIEFANETIVENLGRLENVGDTVGPFPLGSQTWWIHLVEIDQPPQHDLYDPIVQLTLTRDIQMMRSNEEQDRYIATLLEKGIYDEITGMGERLLEIALLRYAR